MLVRITSYRLLKTLQFFKKKPSRAMSFGPFIIFREAVIASDQRTNVHEVIHFYQQLELLFVFQWLLYVLFYAFKRLRGADHGTAYRLNPFEREAFQNDDDITYLIKRKPYAWLRYLN